MIRLLCVVIGYAFGAFQSAFFYGKLHGIDIREHGSGNAGTTNTLRVLGTKAGLIVFAGDLIKAILALLLVKFVIVPKFPELGILLMFYAGLGCILGHNFPFYMNFKGGKGIACTGGIMIALHWIYVPIGLLLFFGTFAVTHFVSLGSLILYFSFPISTVLLGQLGVFGVSQTVLFEIYGIVAFLTVMAFWKHRANIKRLLSGTESKTYLFKKKKEEK